VAIRNGRHKEAPKSPKEAQEYTEKVDSLFGALCAFLWLTLS